MKAKEEFKEVEVCEVKKGKIVCKKKKVKIIKKE